VTNCKVPYAISHGNFTLQTAANNEMQPGKSWLHLSCDRGFLTERERQRKEKFACLFTALGPRFCPVAGNGRAGCVQVPKCSPGTAILSPFVGNYFFLQAALQQGQTVPSARVAFLAAEQTSTVVKR